MALKAVRLNLKEFSLFLTFTPILSALLCLFVTAHLLILIPFKCEAKENMFDGNFLFEVEIGNKTPVMLGEDTDESKILSYDKFYFPAAIVACEKEDKIFVLDSIKNRICAFNLSGKLIYELALPFSYHPIDIAYFKEFKRFFIVFQQVPVIGVIDINETAGHAEAQIKEYKLIDLKIISPDIVNLNEMSIQNIWPCGSSGNGKNNFDENILLLNVFFSDHKNIVLKYKNGVVSEVKNVFKIEDYAITGAGSDYIMSLSTGTQETRLIKEKLNGGKIDWHALLKELTLGKPGFSCRNLRIIGADLKENTYIEAHYGFGEDRIQKTFVYKFNKNGRFKGRTEIFHSPEMLTNHFITVDLNGSIFYMKKNEKTKKIQFYKFIIDELN